jgi:hypothetical protein
VLTRIAPGRIAAMRSRDRKPRVSSHSSRCIETASLSRSSVSSATKRTPGNAFGWRFQATTFMPMPSARRAISAPIPPKPTRPSVLPVSCTPSLRSHWPARIARSIAA